MEIEKLIFREAARMDAYKGLAECYHLPNKDLSLRLKDLEQQLSTLGSTAFTYTILMRSEFQGSQDYEKFKIDFAQLFVGPYSLVAAPYGSVYLEGERKIMGNSTIDVEKRYKEAGLIISQNFKDAPDHIAAELEFMYFLVFKEIEAIKAEDHDVVSDQLLKQRSFLQDHIGLWTTEFAEHIEKDAKTDFYRNLAITTRIFIAEELEGITHLSIPELADTDR